MTRRRAILSLVAAAAMVAAHGPAFGDDLLGTGRALIPPPVERMVRKGLQYLAETQQPNGHWAGQRGNEPGVVGMAVLAFLAHGQDPEYGEYAEVIKRALDDLMENANPQNGYMGNSMYNHGFATLALAEAYGRVQDERLGPALENAVECILASQKSNAQGGWRYSPQSTDADTTVSGACLVALFAAKNAGVKVPDEAIESALDFYRRCHSPDGGFGYTDSGSSSPPRTAIGVLVFALAHERDNALFKRGLARLKAMGTQSNYPYYQLYYEAQAAFQADAEYWERWNKRNTRTLQQTQARRGCWTGPHGETFSTAAALLSMALNYRYLPIYER